MTGEVEHYVVEQGNLLAGEYPYDRSPVRGAARLQSLVEEGVRTFIDLTTLVDGLTPYEGALPEMEDLAAEEVKRLAFPVPDMGVPDDAGLMRSVLDAIALEIEEGRMCYVHCWGGIGRTGTVVGCFFREQGLDEDEALERVQALYAGNMPKAARLPFSPQTVIQRDYVRNWKVDR